jgi:hypothetical protein
VNDYKFSESPLSEILTLFFKSCKSANPTGGAAKRVFELGGGTQNHPTPSSSGAPGELEAATQVILTFFCI